MAKKRLISSFLLCVFAIIFAHSVVPHHHEEELVTHHQTLYDVNHDDISSDFLGEAFSHFQHEQGGTIIYETVSAEYKCPKANWDKATVLLVQYILKGVHKSPIEHPEPYPLQFSTQFCRTAEPLRGPPAVMG